MSIPYGADVSGGAFECLDCGYGLQIRSTESLPPCPNFDATHTRKSWKTLYGKGESTAR